MLLIAFGIYFYLSSTFFPNSIYKRVHGLLEPYFGVTTDIFFMVFGIILAMIDISLLSS